MDNKETQALIQLLKFSEEDSLTGRVVTSEEFKNKLKQQMEKLNNVK